MQRLFAPMLLIVAACTPTAEPSPSDAGATDAGIDAGTLHVSDAGSDGGVDAGPDCQTTCVGCCLDGHCLELAEQSVSLCGVSGARCRPCSLAETCAARGCVPWNNPDGGIIGAPGSPCDEDTDCGSDNLGTCIREFRAGEYSGYPGGYCTRSCPDDRCPEDATCIPTTWGPNMCFASCTGDAGCRAGYACRPSGGASDVCAP